MQKKSHLKTPKNYDLETLFDGIQNKNRALLGKSISILESNRKSDKKLAEKLLEKCLKKGQKSKRIGITGVPGAGKSTFIEAFGKLIIDSGFSLAVLAIDPSSGIGKGSILGDKTRMEKLANEENVFIRPSPSSGSLGGVAKATHESIILCEAASFDFIFVETVGVGQAEYLVKNMVDMFVMLSLPNAGDELQGIKRGIMEVADLILVNKADGESVNKAKQTAKQLEMSLHLFQERNDSWIPKVLKVSSLEKSGMDSVFECLNTFFRHQTTKGRLEENRRNQESYWFEFHFNNWLHDKIDDNQLLKKLKNASLSQIKNKEITAFEAAIKLTESIDIEIKERSRNGDI